MSVQEDLAYLAGAAREWLALQRDNPGRGSPGRDKWNFSQQEKIDKGPTGAVDPAQGVYRQMLTTRTLGSSVNVWGSLVLDASLQVGDRPFAATQGWSRLRAKITFGVGGLSQTVFCDWGSNIVQVPLNDLTVECQYGPCSFVGTGLDRPLGDDPANEPPYMVRAALVERIRPQPVPVTFTYAFVPDLNRVTIPPFAKAWHAVPAIAGGPGFGVNTKVRLLRGGTARAEWIYPFNPSNIDGNMPGTLGQHGPEQLRVVGDAELVIEDPNGNPTVIWFDIAF